MVRMEQRVHQFTITRGRKSDINAPICRWYWESLDFSTFSPCPHRRCLKRHKFTKRVAECAVFASSLSWRPAQKQIEIEDEVKSLCIHNKMWILQQACTHYLITCYSCFCLPITCTPPKWRQLFMYEDDDRRMTWETKWMSICVERKWRPPWKPWESRPVAAVSCQRPK